MKKLFLIILIAIFGVVTVSAFPAQVPYVYVDDKNKDKDKDKKKDPAGPPVVKDKDKSKPKDPPKKDKKPDE